MDEWVRVQYRKAYCDNVGQIIASKIDLDAFREDLKALRPDEAKEVTSAVKKLDKEICSDLCRDLPTDKDGRFLNAELAQQRLQEVRTDLVDKKRRKAIIKRIQEENVAMSKVQQSSAGPSAPRKTKTGKQQTVSATAEKNAEAHTWGGIEIAGDDRDLYRWIHTQYLSSAFNKVGFVGWKKFEAALKKQKPHQPGDIGLALQHLRVPGHEYSLEDPLVVQQVKSSARQQQGGVQVAKALPVPTTDDQLALKKVPEMQLVSLGSASPQFTFNAGGSKSPILASAKQVKAEPATIKKPKAKATTKPAKANPETLAKQMQQIDLDDSSSVTPASSGSGSVAQGTPRTSTPDIARFSQLLTGKKKSIQTGNIIQGTQRDLEQAPLLSGSVVLQHAHDFVPQFGLLGCLAGQDPSESASQVFLNTNVPVSTFICGVQGSGKSHTTSCILENAVIPSPHLGQLESPVSTLVFSYGEWSSGGAGFNISEATYLAAPSKVFPGHQVKRITVLTSPSNLAIKKLYQRHPNVRIIPFRLRAKTLDIGALRTLMAIDEKSNVPLYMAKVESILRDIAGKSKDGSLDYTRFKKALKLETFDATQTNMLEMRLNLLESFLDLTDTAPQPDYLPGEITIMDLSDAFISPSTACILFKLGLERFLQCETPGKLVVLDEAHKYMLNTPGSKVLTEYLTRVIRLQRHQGARVVISTQEPTVSTDLIALCSITVIHRFTSPAWYNALKKHINAMDDDERIMHDIEGLETGEAFVYAPNAVLGKKEDGALIKATGRLLKLNIRDRVTADGGESIMAI